MFGKIIFSYALFLSCLVCTGTACMSWEPGWSTIDRPTSTGDTAVLLAKAEGQLRRADTKEGLTALIAIYEQVIRIDPWNYRALVGLGSYYHLMAMAHAATRSDIVANERLAVRYAERAMYTNRKFRTLVDMGDTTWGASQVLTKREMCAMHVWEDSILFCWEAGLTWAGKLCSPSWPFRVKPVLDRMTALGHSGDEECPLASCALYYARIPRFMGGDREKAGALFSRSLKQEHVRTMILWARAKYLYAGTGNRPDFEADLIQAANIQQDSGEPYPWSAFYRKDARQMLSMADSYLK